MNRAAVTRFAAIAARVRAAVWPVTVQVSGGTELDIAKSPSKVERTQNGQGTGWVKRTLATFNFPGDGAFVPTIGAQWTITESTIADEVGTTWRCFDLTRTGAGTEHRCVCFKLD